MKQVLSYWEPLCSITLNKKDQNLKTVRALKENTYVDNLMQTGANDEELMRFKEESTAILESARLPVHKWESNVKFLESEGMPNPSKILGHAWNKDNDTLEPLAKPFPQEHPVTKRTILSYLGTVSVSYTHLTLPTIYSV